MSGLLLKDLIAGGESRWREVYDPARKTPTGIVNYISENVTALKSFAQKLMPGEVETPDAIERGEGAIVRRGAQRIAAYRDQAGKLHERSASCTHLGCEIQWNSTEGCWDCPCHGSQFSPQGDVLNAPAVANLAPAEGAPERASKTKEKAE